MATDIHPEDLVYGEHPSDHEFPTPEQPEPEPDAPTARSQQDVQRRINATDAFLLQASEVLRYVHLHLAATDRANAAVNMSEPRYRPLTLEIEQLAAKARALSPQ